mmetsp:Transcript_12835/g.32318  ORF Transcript_12835/g.32318 Transcript_12835/m.32318 type:complete len:210 (-) Transcript_12835:141-770(-)
MNCFLLCNSHSVPNVFPLHIPGAFKTQLCAAQLRPAGPAHRRHLWYSVAGHSFRRASRRFLVSPTHFIVSPENLSCHSTMILSTVHCIPASIHAFSTLHSAASMSTLRVTLSCPLTNPCCRHHSGKLFASSSTALPFLWYACFVRNVDESAGVLRVLMRDDLHGYCFSSASSVRVESRLSMKKVMFSVFPHTGCLTRVTLGSALARGSR